MRTGISKTLTTLFYLLCCVALVWASGLSALNHPFTSRAMNDDRSNTEPTIDKTSLQVTTRRHIAYWGGGGGRGDETTWSWTPRISFRVNGPIASGSQLTVGFSLPGGKSWVKFDSPTQAIGADHRLTNFASE